MARYLGPTCKLARREGTDLFLKSGVKALDSVQHRTSSAAYGAHGKVSDYGLQLRELRKFVVARRSGKQVCGYYKEVFTGCYRWNC